MTQIYKPHPNQGFFYLNDGQSNPVSHVKSRLLISDIQRGVKRLSESAFLDQWGSTRASMRFMNALRRTIDVTATRAQLKYSQLNHYTLVVYTRSGFELVFKGVSGGYHGEGTRGCYDILKLCGFSETQCQKVWSQQTFTVIKSLTS
jgi:hypothetical protein